MDEHLILIGTETEAKHDLEIINLISAQYYAGSGYTVEHGATGFELIGKNAATNQDNPNAQRTVTWDEIKEHNGQFYFTSLSNDPRFKDWRDYLPDGVSMQCQEIAKDWVDKTEFKT